MGNGASRSAGPAGSITPPELDILDGKAFLPYILSMTIALTITAKGQVTFRKDLLQHLGVGPGEKLTVTKLPNGKIEICAKRLPGKISDVFDMLKLKTDKKLTLEEIKQAIEVGWAGKR